MRKDVVVDVSAADRARLKAIVADRNSPQKHVWRARIILLTAAALGTAVAGPIEVVRPDVCLLAARRTERCGGRDTSRKRLSRIRSPSVAVRLGKLFGDGAEVWVRMQGGYDTWQARRELGKEIDKVLTLEALAA